MTEKTTPQTESSARAVGRRKTASARVRISPGTGTIVVNGRELTEYFPTKFWQDMVRAPLRAVGKETGYDISAKVQGGGPAGQAEAVRHGIARALVAWNPDFKLVLRAEGFMTRDSRAKERKKFGLRGARRGRQWRKR